MRVHPSALKHGIGAADALAAAKAAVYIAMLDDENPGRELRLGFDGSARLLELVILRFTAATS